MGVLQGLASNNGHLYAAWKGEPGDDRIFYSSWNGSGNWAPASPMASDTVGGNTSVGPSLGVFNGSLYAAWKGEWSDPRLFYAQHDGNNWKNQLLIPHAYSDVGPALCGFSSTEMIAAWKTIDQALYYAIYDSQKNKWSEPSQIPGVASSVGPSLASYKGKVYAAWKGKNNDQSLWYAIYDGSTWSGQVSGTNQTQIPGVGSSVGPSLASVGNTLYAVWKGEGSDETLWYAQYDGSNWSGKTAGTQQTQIAGSGSSVGAAIAGFKGNLYAMAKGKDADPGLYTAEFTNNSWLGWSNDIPGNTGPDSVTPQPAPAGSRFNYTLADSTGAFLNGTTVTMIVVDDIVTQNGANYSLQINCLGPTQSAATNAPGWQQFGFRMGGGKLFSWVNTFQNDGLKSPQYINWDSRSMAQGVGWVALTNNRLPKDWQLTTSLATDQTGNVTGLSFSVTQADGTVVINSGPQALKTLPGLSSTAVVVPKPIHNFQVVLVAENPVSNGGASVDSVTFTSGKGIFLCYAKNNLSASAAIQETLEVSNSTYSALPASYPNGEFFQFFGAPTI